MSRLEAVGLAEVTGKVKAIFDSLIAHAGRVPNIYQDMANSPGLLQAVVSVDGLIGEGSLTPIEQSIAKLVVAQHYGSAYCRAVCTAIGAGRGLAAEEMLAIRRGKAQDPKRAALVQFTRRMIETRGAVEDSDVDRFRATGYTDAQIGEVITIIGALTMGSFFNNMNHTALDFPQAPEI